MNQDNRKHSNDVRENTQASGLAASVIALAFALAGLGLFPKVARAVNENHGKELFERRCTGCHSLDKDKEGPRLRGVYRRMSGSVPTFAYSDSVKNAHVTWDAASLDKWLTDPDAFIPDGNMAFRLIKSDERAAVITYLKEVSNK